MVSGSQVTTSSSGSSGKGLTALAGASMSSSQVDSRQPSYQNGIGSYFSAGVSEFSTLAKAHNRTSLDPSVSNSAAMSEYQKERAQKISDFEQYVVYSRIPYD